MKRSHFPTKLIVSRFNDGVFVRLAAWLMCVSVRACAAWLVLVGTDNDLGRRINYGDQNKSCLLCWTRLMEMCENCF